eukprot:676638-Amphidinium_carterae.1
MAHVKVNSMLMSIRQNTFNPDLSPGERVRMASVAELGSEKVEVVGGDEETTGSTESTASEPEPDRKEHTPLNWPEADKMVINWNSRKCHCVLEYAQRTMCVSARNKRLTTSTVKLGRAVAFERPDMKEWGGGKESL